MLFLDTIISFSHVEKKIPILILDLFTNSKQLYRFGILAQETSHPVLENLHHLHIQIIWFFTACANPFNNRVFSYLNEQFLHAKYEEVNRQWVPLPGSPF